MAGPPNKTKRYCVLQSSPVDGSLLAVDPSCTPEIYLPEHEVKNVSLKKATATSTILSLVKEGFDCFINLCDGAWDEDRCGIEVGDLLERLGVAYTGASRAFYDPTRLAMKKVAISASLKTPAWRFCRNSDDAPAIAKALNFPMIVKHPQSFGSIGLTKQSRVTDVAGLTRELKRLIDMFGEVLVEEFIEGREFTVLVAENPDDKESPITFVPVECKFPPGESFKHYNVKWKDFEGISWQPVEEPSLNTRLREMASKVFLGLRGRGFGRIDVRSDPSGENLYLLEMNPNCGIFYPPGSFGSADMILSLDPTTSHRRFLENLITCALKDQRAKKPMYEVAYLESRGLGLVATRDIAAGETVLTNEEKPTAIVSAHHINQTCSHEQMRELRRHTWPLSEDTFAMRSADPEEWLPINHSCDPNMWLVGLNAVARRDIGAGEELTIDYATFAVNDEPFACSCGTACCRREIKGDDWARPDVLQKYGDHVSDHVKLLRNPSLPNGKDSV
eukprot:RCo010721